MIYEESTSLTQLNYNLEKLIYIRTTYTNINLRIGVQLCENLLLKGSYSSFKISKWMSFK